MLSADSEMAARGGQNLRRRIENPVLEVGQFDQRRTVYQLSVGPGGSFRLPWGLSISVGWVSSGARSSAGYWNTAP